MRRRVVFIYASCRRRRDVVLVGTFPRFRREIASALLRLKVTDAFSRLLLFHLRNGLMVLREIVVADMADLFPFLSLTSRASSIIFRI